MTFKQLFSENQQSEVEQVFADVIFSGQKEPVRILNEVLRRVIGSDKHFIADAIEAHRAEAMDYVKSIMENSVTPDGSENITEDYFSVTTDTNEATVIMDTAENPTIATSTNGSSPISIETAPTTPAVEIIIDPEFKSLIPPLRSEELNLLQENILQEGCRDPLVTWGDILLDGHNRYEICQRNNIPFSTVQAAVRDREEAMMWIIKNQLSRRNLSDYDRGVMALSYKEYFKRKAKENQGKRIDILQNSAECLTPVDTRKELAKLAGISHDTITKIEKIEKDGSPELKEHVKKGNITINKACQTLKQKQNYQEKKQINLQECLHGRYDVIYADPPWDYSHSGNRGNAEVQYPTMSIQEICNMPVKDYTASNAVLFLWTTNPQLEAAFKVIKAWGFEYKTNFARIKKNQTGGFHNFGKHELLLIATKGTHITPENPQETLRSSVIHDPEDFRVEHSRKPDLYYNLIETEYPGRRYLELFARVQRTGWEVFSNEPELRAA